MNVRVSSVAASLGLLLIAAAAMASPARADQAERLAAGARLAHEAAKGNCLACHAMPSDAVAVTSANIGLPWSRSARAFLIGNCCGARSGMPG